MYEEKQKTFLLLVINERKVTYTTLNAYEIPKLQ